MKVIMNTCGKTNLDVEEGGGKKEIHMWIHKKSSNWLNGIKFILFLELVIFVGWMGLMATKPIFLYKEVSPDINTNKISESTSEDSDVMRIILGITEKPEIEENIEIVKNTILMLEKEESSDESENHEKSENKEIISENENIVKSNENEKSRENSEKNSEKIEYTEYEYSEENNHNSHEKMNLSVKSDEDDSSSDKECGPDEKLSIYFAPSVDDSEYIVVEKKCVPVQPDPTDFGPDYQDYASLIWNDREIMW